MFQFYINDINTYYAIRIDVYKIQTQLGYKLSVFFGNI